MINILANNDDATDLLIIPAFDGPYRIIIIIIIVVVIVVVVKGISE